MVKKLISISDDLLEKIKLLAKKEKRNVNSQISYMLEKLIENKAVEPIQSTGNGINFLGSP